MEPDGYNWKFTALLILAMIFMTVFMKPGHTRNDYLNNGSQKCTYGSVDLSISKGDRDSNSNNSNPYWDKREEDNNQITLSFRKDLGISKKTCDQQNRISLQNEKLKQQLELFKKCGSVNRNPTLKDNENFVDLVNYCRGMGVGLIEDTRPTGSLWNKLKKDYKKENPEIKLYGPKNE
tara:strand:- start:38 stop:571 length:534 start_codon:yes stop_codon:yes gene_type:complete